MATMSDLSKPIPKKKFVEERKLQQLDALEDQLEQTMSEINKTKEAQKLVKKKRGKGWQITFLENRKKIP